MDLLARADRLRQEAEFLLQDLNLYDIYAPFGGLTLGGSCRLGMQAYPDLDLYTPPIPLADLYSIRDRLAAHPRVLRVILKESDEAAFPGGMYFKPYVQYGDWQRPWKIDIWSVEPRYFEPQVAQLDRWKELLTPDLRAQIVAYKVSILTSEHRTPMYSGYFIYRAFFDLGLREFGDVTRYLLENGIAVEGTG